MQHADLHALIRASFTREWRLIVNFFFSVLLSLAIDCNAFPFVWVLAWWRWLPAAVFPLFLGARALARSPSLSLFGLSSSSRRGLALWASLLVRCRPRARALVAHRLLTSIVMAAQSRHSAVTVQCHPLRHRRATAYRPRALAECSLVCLRIVRAPPIGVARRFVWRRRSPLAYHRHLTSIGISCAHHDGNALPQGAVVGRAAS